MNYVPPRRSDGTIQHRRVKQPWPADRPFRILSIDGGGICGILPASVLTEFEQRYLGGSPISAHFDMIAGTSTGGIIALALAHGLTAKNIRDVYVERGHLIFPPASKLGGLFRGLRRTRRAVYDSRVLESELLRIFGETTFGEAQKRLVIPAFEGAHGEPWLFKTPHHPDYRKDRFERMTRVGLATAAAPTYFEAFLNNGYVMVDGGLWANNPVMNAVVDALSCFEIDPRQIHVLSLGCGETSFVVDDAKRRGGAIQWRHALLAAMRAQSLNALGQAYLLVGKDQVIRVDAPESKTPIPLDDHRRACTELPAMARSLAEAAGRDVARAFLSEPAERFTPCPIVSSSLGEKS